MDLIYYKERLRKFKHDYLEKYFRNNKLLVLYIILHLLLIGSSVIMLEILEMSKVYMIVALVVGTILLLIQYVKIYRFYIKTKDKFLDLLINIVNEESDFEVNKKDTVEYYDLIKTSRLIEKSDSISIKWAFNYRNNGKEYYIINTEVSRSTGKSSTQILNGVVYFYKVESNDNLVIRNDYQSMQKGKRIKEYSTKEYNVYFSRSLLKDDLGEPYLPKLNNNRIDDYLKIKNYSKKYSAIDFNLNDINVYIDKKEVIKIPKDFSDKNILLEIDKIINQITISSEIEKIINKQE